ncbi:MAG: phosphatidylglycerophosphatase A [Pseudomonadota bacterium]|nr:phosphatidylglycerophosphatase A [Pseudomonadota bacterium]
MITSSERLRVDVWRNPVHFLAFGFGAGLAPRAPGTAGTMAAIPLYLCLAPLPLMPYLLITALLFAVGVYVCDRTSRDLGVHDHGGIVWDEIVGFLVTMAALPAQWPWIVAGFVLFRAFDIVKPWPIRWVDRRVTGGFGIMADDLLAGVYAWLALQGLAWSLAAWPETGSRAWTG